MATLLSSVAMSGCQPAASSPSGKAKDTTEKQPTSKGTESGIKPPNPDPGK